MERFRYRANDGEQASADLFEAFNEMRFGCKPKKQSFEQRFNRELTPAEVAVRHLQRIMNRGV